MSVRLPFSIDSQDDGLVIILGPSTGILSDHKTSLEAKIPCMLYNMGWPQIGSLLTYRSPRSHSASARSSRSRLSLRMLTARPYC